MRDLPPVVAELAIALTELGWVTELFVAGSAATGDYVDGVSDLDLVALTRGAIDPDRRAVLEVLHRHLDGGAAAGMDLGCVYIPERSMLHLDAVHPTWTHGRMIDGVLSGITRAELAHHGLAVFGRSPRDLLPAVTDDDVRDAARAELTDYWSLAAARPWWWLDPDMVDLGLTSMARGRHALANGRLLTKSEAIDASHAPAWLIEQMRARRQGEHVTSPRLRSAWIAWRDARRTTALARRRPRHLDASP
ncbi:MAG: hypothetical protein CMH83_05320 [Nocardioides sp.]|nr:hypothetical protein [Nocardioides sp.]